MRIRALAMVSLTVGLIAAPAGATVVTLNPTGDTYLRSGAQNSNEGDATFVRINSSPNRALVRFDQAQIAGAAAGMVLVSASLELYVTASNSWGPGRDVNAHRMMSDWTEAGATWSCGIDTNTGNGSPDCASQWGGGTFAATRTSFVLQTDAVLNQYASWDVTADVAAFLAGTPNYGWMIRKDLEAQNGSADYNSREAAANRPRLVLNVVLPTSTPAATAQRDGHQHAHADEDRDLHRDRYADADADADDHRHPEPDAHAHLHADDHADADAGSQLPRGTARRLQAAARRQQGPAAHQGQGRPA